jgi:hypothetical protein
MNNFLLSGQVYPVAGSAILPAPRPEKKMMTGDLKGQGREIRDEKFGFQNSCSLVGNWHVRIKKVTQGIRLTLLSF